MKSTKLPLLMAASAMALTACTSGPNPKSPFASITREAGSLIDNGSFGHATLNNHAYHSGERNYVVDLNNRFSQEVQTTVNFAFNSSQLDEDARAVLRVQANWIRQFPEIKFKVYGHTDAVGSNASNKRLGLRRANAIVGFFASQGIERGRLQAVVSLGESQPIIVSQNRERLNRRTVTEVSGFVDQTTPLDGKYAAVIYREYVESGTEASSSEQGGLARIASAGGG